jgi:cyclic beta-1,2-glucan synthetase
MEHKVEKVETILLDDPAGIYPKLHLRTQQMYQGTVVSLASFCAVSECEIAMAANHLASQNQRDANGAAHHLAHNGYYLCDEGIDLLCNYFGKQRSRKFAFTYVQRRSLFQTYCWLFYVVGGLLSLLGTVTLPRLYHNSFEYAVEFTFLLCLSLTTGLAVVGMYMAFQVTPAQLPALRLKSHELLRFESAFVVPCKLINHEQVQELSSNAEVLLRSNTCLGLRFVILIDHKDRLDHAEEVEQAQLLDYCRELFVCLNRKYDNPFTLLYRDLVYNERQGVWMGWERKRGKIEEFYRYLSHQPSGFKLVCGEPVSSELRYAIVLDDDSVIGPADVLDLLGLIKHPLNTAIVDETAARVTRGFGLVQPAIRVTETSAEKWRFPRFLHGAIGPLSSGESARSPMQELLGQSVFGGKGVLDLKTYGQVLANRLPENLLLSHDQIEGALLKTATDPRALILEDIPSGFKALNMRRHRWIRGDWQNILWLFPMVKDHNRRFVRNPLDVFHRWILAENIRRSLCPIALASLLLWASSMGSSTFWVWLIGIAVLCLIPQYINAALGTLQHMFTPKEKRTGPSPAAKLIIDANLRFVLLLMMSGYESLLNLDAIGRSLLRLITGHHRLEWNSAAQASRTKAPFALLVVHVSAISVMSLFVLLLLCVIADREVAQSYAPLLILWICSAFIAKWLQSPSSKRSIGS